MKKSKLDAKRLRVVVVLSGLTIGFFLIAVLIFYKTEDWLGKKELDRCRSAWSQAGRPFSAENYFPEVEPKEKNAACLPPIATLFDYTLKTNFNRGLFADYIAPAVEFNDLPAFEHLAELADVPWTNPPLGVFTRCSFVNLKGWLNVLSNCDNCPPLPPGTNSASRILAGFSRDNNIRREIEASMASSQICVFPVRYQDGCERLGPHLRLFQTSVCSLVLRSVCELRIRKMDDSIKDWSLGLSLSEAFRSDAGVGCQNERAELFPAVLQPVWEGIKARVWNEKQLALFQHRLESVDFLGYYQNAVLAETRITLGDFFNKVRAGRYIADDGQFFLVENTNAVRPTIRSRLLRRAMPMGCIDHSEAVVSLFVLKECLPMVTADGKRIDLQAWDRAGREVKRLPVSTGYTWLKESYLPGFIDLTKNLAYAQTLANEAILACALERYYLKFKSYPENLEVLCPSFLAKLPIDVVNGQPLIYRQTPDGRYKIYSVAWNGEDDDGKPIDDLNGKQINAEDALDWVWAYSLEKK